MKDSSNPKTRKKGAAVKNSSAAKKSRGKAPPGSRGKSKASAASRNLTGTRSQRSGIAPPDIVRMSSTEAQNRFGHVLNLASRNSTVMITRREATQAVVMSVDRYRELTRTDRPDLGRLTAEFDEIFSRMQEPASRKAVREAFDATPADLGAAAVAAAKRGKQ